MRNHKTGCGRCSRKVCCCPRTPTSCICPPGPPGPAGPPGPPGSDATPGAGGGGLLKFSGTVAVGTIGVESYLADGGLIVGTFLEPLEYISPVDRILENLTVNVLASQATFGGPGTLTFDLLIDGVVALSVVATGPGPQSVAFGTVVVLTGQTIALRATSSAALEITVAATAMVGVSS